MSANLLKLDELLTELKPFGATLVAVSKTKPVNDILDVYNHGYKIFGENYVQELVNKQPDLPSDINWHFIGHLQSNKVKMIVPFVNLIHGVESWKLAEEISKQALKFGRIVDILLQVHIAKEETKFGLNNEETTMLVNQYFANPLPGVRLRGLMGMASFTENENLVRSEFRGLRELFDSLRLLNSAAFNNDFNILSMGMSGDYRIALEEGSTMIRVGSAIFGERT